jgi:transcriptional regulator with XRE-family HTH domain
MGLNLGEHIRKLRKSKGFTVKELAKYAKISKSYLDYIESGRREPSPEKLQSLALALNDNVDSLIKIQATDNIYKAENSVINHATTILKTQELEMFMRLNMKEYLDELGWATSFPNDAWGDIKAEKNGKLWFVNLKIIVNSRKVPVISTYTEIGGLMCNVEKLGYDCKYSIVSNSKEFIQQLIKITPKLITDNIDLSFYVISDEGDITQLNAP